MRKAEKKVFLHLLEGVKWGLEDCSFKMSVTRHHTFCLSATDLRLPSCPTQILRILLNDKQQVLQSTEGQSHVGLYTHVVYKYSDDTFWSIFNKKAKLDTGQ